MPLQCITLHLLRVAALPLPREDPTQLSRRFQRPRIVSTKKLAPRVERDLRGPIGAIQEPEVEIGARNQVNDLRLEVGVFREIGRSIVDRLIEELVSGDTGAALVERVIQPEQPYGEIGHPLGPGALLLGAIQFLHGLRVTALRRI